MASIGHGVKNAATGKTVIDRLSMRNILPQWDPNKRLSEQYPHIAITVLSFADGTGRTITGMFCARIMILLHPASS